MICHLKWGLSFCLGALVNLRTEKFVHGQVVGQCMCWADYLLIYYHESEVFSVPVVWGNILC